MTRTHFRTFAEASRDEYITACHFNANNGLDESVPLLVRESEIKMFARVARQFNPAFSESRFREACEKP